MGWLSMTRSGMVPFATPKAYLDNQCTYAPDPEKGRDKGLRVLKSTVRSNAYYAACQSYTADGPLQTFAIFVLRNFEFLGPNPAPATLQNIGVELWRREPERVAVMLAETGSGNRIAISAIDSVQLDSLIAGIKAAPSLSNEVLHRRPQVVGGPSFWSLEGLDVRAALTLAASDPSLAAAASNALVASTHDLAYPAVEALGAACVGRAVLQVDMPLNVGRSWYEAVSAHP